MRVFVYGTLRRGEAYAGEMRGLTYLGAGWTQPIYSMVDCGAWPAMLEDGTTAIYGELYEATIRQIEALDRFEGVPHLYLRIDVRMADGTTAAGYVMPAYRVVGKAVIPGGDWVRREEGPA